MIESVLRRVFKAPSITVFIDEEPSLHRYSLGLPEFMRSLIGVEAGEQVFINTDRVTVYDTETPVGSTYLVGLLGNGPHTVRRVVLSRLLRHLVGASWTLVGMLIVLLTLSGAVQYISLMICLIGFALDVMSISLRNP